MRKPAENVAKPGSKAADRQKQKLTKKSKAKQKKQMLFLKSKAKQKNLILIMKMILTMILILKMILVLIHIYHLPAVDHRHRQLIKRHTPKSWHCITIYVKATRHCEVSARDEKRRSQHAGRNTRKT